MSEELTATEEKVLKWLVKSEFHTVPWSTKDAAKAFKIKEEEM